MTPDIATWRVLVVDDEADNLNLIADLLDYSGATTSRAKDGLEGLALVDTFQPNFILLDLGMPSLDGWEVQRRLRLRPELRGVPIVALTALAMPDDAERVHTAGFDAYITKPFRVREVLNDLKRSVVSFTARLTNSETMNPGTDAANAAPITKSEITEQINHE